LLISILEKLNYLRGSIGLCENHRRPAILCDDFDLAVVGK